MTPLITIGWTFKDKDDLRDQRLDMARFAAFMFRAFGLGRDDEMARRDLLPFLQDAVKVERPVGKHYTLHLWTFPWPADADPSPIGIYAHYTALTPAWKRGQAPIIAAVDEHAQSFLDTHNLTPDTVDIVRWPFEVKGAYFQYQVSIGHAKIAADLQRRLQW